jgi:hypothetical protein
VTAPPGYGYKQRADPPPREVAGGQSRVTLPENAETRRTDIVSKTNFGVPTVVQANVDDFYAFPRADGGNQYIGKAASTAGGANTWNTDILRYSRKINLGTSIALHRLNIGLTPRALVDPLFPPTGIIVKLQDLVRAFFTGPLNAQHGKCYFAIGPSGGSSADTPPVALVGFRAFYSVLGVNPTWTTIYTSKDGSIVRTVDTGLQCDTMRLLSVVFDGKLQQIRWYANGVLVDTYSPSSGEVGGQTTTVGNDVVMWLATSSSTGGIANMDGLMLPAPLITIQFPDA